MIRAELAQDPEFRARFRREVAVARTVSGLYTAPVLDADTDGPEPWLATAYVPGPSLAAGIRLAVERCLAKDPAARPTAATLLARPRALRRGPGRKGPGGRSGSAGGRSPWRRPWPW